MNERYVAKMSEVVKLCKENTTLRRQVEELRQALETVAREATEGAFGGEADFDDLYSALVLIDKTARAVLARVGGEEAMLAEQHLKKKGGNS